MAFDVHRDLAPQRWERLRALLRANRVVRVEELCRQLGASAATIRRDLAMLERLGEVERVHGGAVCVENRIEEPLFDDKAHQNRREKRAIARAALAYVSAGDTVYLDGGSTVLELARLLRDRTNLTVVTNSLRAALELAGAGPRLIVVGGELRRLSQTLVGPLTQHTLAQLCVDRAFMGTFGLSQDGMTTTDPDEAFTKQFVMSRARQVILLADSSKLGKVAMARAGDLDRIHVLISDTGLDRTFAKQLEKRGIKVELTGSKRR